MSKNKLPTINELFSGRKNPKPGTFGIEVEVEAGSPRSLDALMHNRSEDVTSNWRLVGEGSVRTGCEFVLAKPYEKPTKDKAVDNLYGYLGKCDVQWSSPRTSVHVHINMTDVDILDTYKYITAYALMEELLLEYCEKRRKGNLFCLSFQDAEYLSHELRKDIGNHGCLGFTNRNDRIRYAATNLSSLAKFGSMEFRSLHGNAKAVEVKEWSDALAHLRDRSVQFANPQDIVDRYFVSDPVEFCSFLLPSSFNKKVCKGREWPQLIEKNMGLVANFAYATDWNKWVKIIEEKEKAKKKQIQDIGFDLESMPLGEVIDRVMNGEIPYDALPPHYQQEIHPDDVPRVHRPPPPERPILDQRAPRPPRNRRRRGIGTRPVGTGLRTEDFEVPRWRREGATQEGGTQLDRTAFGEILRDHPRQNQEEEPDEI